MESAIMSIFNQIMTYLNGQDLQNLLGQNLQEAIYDAYDLVGKLQVHVVGPLALSILAIFVLLEFQKISMKVEGAGGAPMLGFEMIIKAFIKFVICYIVILRIQDILNGIVIISSHLATRVMELGSKEIIENLQSVVEKAVSDLSGWEQLVVLLIMCIMFLVALVVRVIIQVTIYLRFLELYIFCAMAPIPMGALPSQEFSAMSKGFFKNFAAIGLQGTFIALVLVIYPTIFKKILDEVGWDMWGLILGMTVYMLALLLSITKTKGWAKSLLSAS